MKFGGLFDHLNADKNINGHKQIITCLGLNEFPHCGNPVEVLNAHKLSGGSIAKLIGSALGEELNQIIPEISADYSEAPQ